jgi:RHS repeat-associated protein
LRLKFRSESDAVGNQLHGSNTGKNTGDVYGITDYTNGNLLQTFTYDSLNRISTAATADGTTYNQQFTIDAWGNVAQSGSPMFQQNFTVSNQVLGYCYDADGNMLDQGGCVTPHAYSYDAENRIIATNGGSVYTYDAAGQRVGKNLSSRGGTEYFYFGGLPVAELSGGVWSDYIFDGSRRIAMSTSAGAGDPSGSEAAQTTTYYHGDHLGSSRMMTSGTYSTDGKVWSALYSPYGQMVSGSLPSHYQFTGKEYDSDTGLNYFGARYYASNMGRWMSPDWAEKPTAVPYANYGNPQSLNLYAYVNNRPVSVADPDGHEPPAEHLAPPSVPPMGTSDDVHKTDPNKVTEDHIQTLAQATKAIMNAIVTAIVGPVPPPPAPASTPAPPGPQLSPNLKDNVPAPPPGSPAGKMLQCTQSCLPVQITVSSTNEPYVVNGTNVHAPPDPHGTNQALDAQLPSAGGNKPSPSLLNSYLQCSAHCGAQNAINEYSKPSANANGGHVHTQTRPGPGGSRGVLPDAW